MNESDRNPHCPHCRRCLCVVVLKPGVLRCTRCRQDFPAPPQVKAREPMTDEEKIKLTADLIRRKAEWIARTAKELAELSTGEHRERVLMYALLDLEGVFDGHEVAPDATYMREFFLVRGDHAVLTEDGWMDAEYAEEGAEILDEVNAPSK